MKQRDSRVTLFQAPRGTIAITWCAGVSSKACSADPLQHNVKSLHTKHVQGRVHGVLPSWCLVIQVWRRLAGRVLGSTVRYTGRFGEVGHVQGCGGP